MHANDDGRAGAPVLQHAAATHTVLLLDQQVRYLQRRSQRRTVGMRITRDGLVVGAPGWMSQHALDAILQKKAAWILDKLQAAQAALTADERQALRWEDGMQLPYLGQPLRIHLYPAPSRRVQARLHLDGQDQVLQLCLQDASPVRVRAVLQQWYRGQALSHYQQRVAHFAPRLGVQCQALQLSSARTRWGSATSRGTIRLHWGLMHFDPELVDYVVVHELAHLHEMNHSPRFWQWVGQMLPNYNLLRQRLRASRLPPWDPRP